MCIFTSCKDDDEEEEVHYTFTLNAGQPSDDGYEISQGKTWKSSDKIAVISTLVTREITSLSYSGSSFSGYSTNMLSSNNFAFFYPAEELTTAHSDTITQVFNMEKQDGTENSLLDYRYGYQASIAPTGTSASTSVTMRSILANADMKFTCNGAPINDIRKLEFRAIEGELYGHRTFNFRKQTYETGTYNTLIIKNSNGLNGTATLALIPTDNVLLEVSVFTGDGSIYVGSNNEETAIKEGKHYNWTFECNKENSLAHIGDYVYNDMTVSSVFNAEKKCIGVVFALTDTEDGAINKNLTESFHGRLVALKDVYSTGRSWATSQYNITGMPDYTTADGTQEEAFLPYWDYKSANSYYEDARINATITSDGRIDTWPTSGLLSDFNGKENTAYADTSAVLYGACGSAASYAIKGITNKRFYCPSGGEMALLYELHRTGIITAATKQSFEDFEPRAYWVAAEREENRAWYIQFSTGLVAPNYKTSSYKVRPLMHF